MIIEEKEAFWRPRGVTTGKKLGNFLKTCFHPVYREAVNTI
jgi:hypothetical protein